MKYKEYTWRQSAVCMGILNISDWLETACAVSQVTKVTASLNHALIICRCIMDKLALNIIWLQY